MGWHPSIIGMGASAFITSTDGKTVLKGQGVWEHGRRCANFEHPSEAAIVREAAIYKLLGDDHPQILVCSGLEEIHPGVRALRLELAPLGDLRRYLEKHTDDPPPLRTRLDMALDVARGLVHVHSRGVWRSDLSTKNSFLFPGFRVKIGDFGGSVCEALGYYDGGTLEDQDCSAMYEIVAWARVFPGLDEEEIEERLGKEEFPSVVDDDDALVIGRVIDGCWKECYSTADDDLQDLKSRVDLVHGGKR